MQIQGPKGTEDVTPPESWRWQLVEAAQREICARYGYREVRTPVFEHTELFLRGVGDTTDVVQKEMYTFEDKGGRSVTLKPEGTAGVVRMMLESRLYAEPMPIKTYYVNCPVFRYEKPQSGRLREHHQFGVEAFGAPQPTADAEQIALAWELLHGLGLYGLELCINSIGCPNCRPVYHQRLKDFLASRLDALCDTCKDRYGRNPLRILDCKSPACQTLLVGAPSVLDSLCEDCQHHFDALQRALGALNVPFSIDPGIVRGLDYYTKTVFEIIGQFPVGKLTLCGGGRYDGLVEQLGGPSLAGVGFGMGTERVLLALQQQEIAQAEPALMEVFLCTQNEAARMPGLGLVKALRDAGVRADMDHVGRSMKAQFKFADKCGARLVAVLGEEELSGGTVTLRDMRTREEARLPLGSAAAEIARKLEKP